MWIDDLERDELVSLLRRQLDELRATRPNVYRRARIALESGRDDELAAIEDGYRQLRYEDIAVLIAAVARERRRR